MKSKYKSPKLTFLEAKPKLFQYIQFIKLDLDSVISIEHKDGLYIFKGLAFIYQIQTDSAFSFFRTNLFLNEIVSEAS